MFPARPPLARDTDLDSASVACRREPTAKDPNHEVCAPRPYVSPLVWDAVDNSVFRPLSDALAVRSPGEARNANSLDEVADSAWFTNRMGVREMTVEELRRGACRPEQLLDPATAAEGSWVIDRGKADGASLGFRMVVPGKGKYMIKNDPTAQPERATAASVIGAAAYHAVGFFASCEQVVYLDPKILKLIPGLRYANNSGVEHVFDQRALDRVLAEASHRGKLVRLQASAWLPGYLLGPFRYEGTRDDDPNDVIAHEDRRELRGGRLLAAWLNHFDAREQNSMDTWLADRPDHPDSSPGHVRHYYLDVSDALGSEWDWDEISRRLGRSYLLDWGDIGLDFVSFGARTPAWEKVRRTAGREKFGYFDVDTFDPAGWKSEYPNPAFSRMTERDGAWMARILARLSPELNRALAEMGQFSDPGDTVYLTDVLQRRLEKLLERYLTRLSPLTDVHVENGDTLCALDLARWRGVRPSQTFRYEARASTGGPLATTVRPGGGVCLSLPPPDRSGGYLVVSIGNGVAPGALVVHLRPADEGRAHRVVGLERLPPGRQ
jgi:hypothetical protein